MNRRGFLKSILAAGVAPYVVTTSGVLMPIRALAEPRLVLEHELFGMQLIRTGKPQLGLISSLDIWTTCSVFVRYGSGEWVRKSLTVEGHDVRIDITAGGELKAALGKEVARTEVPFGTNPLIKLISR